MTMNEQAEKISKDISDISIALFNESTFGKIDDLKNELKKQNTTEERVLVLHNLYREFNTLKYANIKELHENLEVFLNHSDEELRSYRKKASEKISELIDSIFKDEYINSILEEHQSILKKKEEERQKTLIFNNKSYEVAMKTEVYWSGWECDDTAYIIKHEDGLKLITSDHGRLMITDKKFLTEKIEEYRDAIRKHEEMLKLLD